MEKRKVLESNAHYCIAATQSTVKQTRRAAQLHSVNKCLRRTMKLCGAAYLCNSPAPSW
ncbi:MAG: hypothetical protein WCQ99_03755 [Pseudomonadota bacterium]